MSIKRRLGAQTAAIALAAVLLVAPSAAQAASDDQTISYYLPKALVGVSLTRTIKACPTADYPEPLIKSEWTAAAEAVPDPDLQVRVDVSNGFLAKRAHAFSYNANGTLAEFNSSSEGQGGAVLGSVFKAASFLLPLAAGAPPVAAMGYQSQSSHLLYCSKAVSQALDRVAKLDARIEEISDKISRGDATAADLRMLDLTKAQRSEARKPLVKVVPTVLSEEWDRAGQDLIRIGGSIAPLPATTWFVSWREGAAPGAIGFAQSAEALQQLGPFEVELEPAYANIKPVLTEADGSVPVQARRMLVYRRPIPAAVVFWPSGCGSADCKSAIELEAPLPIPQWGKLEALSVGHGGLFGSRQAKAKFDAFGTPLELSYGSDSGAAGMATTLDAATAAGESLRDAETAALKRQIEKAELRQKLRDLQGADAD